MLHVAVLLKPYVELLLCGRKTVECRLTRQPRAPFDVIEPGDRIYFKQSCGPYRATARAEHVICEKNLSPKRVIQIQRDYNELICGEQRFWKMKRDSRFCTLVWLKNVKPISTGPAIRRLQGVAWLTLDDAPAWKAPQRSKNSFHIELTPGNLKNNTIYVGKVMENFPDDAIGGPTKQESADPLTLILHDGPTVLTDIVGTRNMLRDRKWAPWFRRHGARPGDHVVFTPVDETTYFVALARGV